MIMIDISSSSSLYLRIPLATSRIAIKFVKSHTCRNVDADALRLCIHTSIPVDRNFKESTRHLKLDSKKKKMSPMENLLAVFPESPLEHHLHVVVKVESGLRR